MNITKHAFQGAYMALNDARKAKTKAVEKLRHLYHTGKIKGLDADSCRLIWSMIDHYEDGRLSEQLMFAFVGVLKDRSIFDDDLREPKSDEDMYLVEGADGQIDLRECSKSELESWLNDASAHGDHETIKAVESLL